DTVYQVIKRDEPGRMPFIWTLLGVKPVDTMTIPFGEFTPQELQRIKKAFPELDYGQFSDLER
ncbi:MAG TPA: hypothetical protein VGJ15_06530, partial [Pirellulales bacterium]